MAGRVQMLAGLKVVDLGVGMAAALVSKFLAELGARVTRVDPPGGDPFDRIYPASDFWRAAATRDASAWNSSDRLHALLDDADICLVGGEDHPDIARRGDGAELSARHPRLVVLDIEGYPAGTSDAGRPAVDILVQARAGLVWEHFTARPVPMAFQPTVYGAVFRGLCGLLAALYERECSGKGQLVSTSLYEGGLSWVVSVWTEMEKPRRGDTFVMPMDPHPLIFRANDGVYIHIVIGGTGSKYKMYKALEIDDPSVLPDDSGMPKPTDDPRNFFGDIDTLAAAVARKSSKELLERIWALGLPAEPVLPPGECWDTPQFKHNGIIATDANGNRGVGHTILSVASPAPRTSAPTAGASPLAGVRVIDFGAFVAGPFASVVLADLGADVIKVETPVGDPNRSIFRSHVAANRGKRAISIDLKDKQGLAIAKALCERSDVVMNNFRPGVSGRLGVDPASLHAMKPSLVALESPAYGSTGPLAERAGFDMVGQALCGLEYRAGGKGNEPLWSRTSMVDYTGGFLGALGVLAALYHRARTGEGMTLESALMSAGAFLVSELVQRPDGRWEGAEPCNAARTGYRPSESLWQTSDGWIAVVVRGKAQAASLARVLGLSGSLDADPLLWSDAAEALIGKCMAGRTTDEIVDALEQAGVWVERCRRNTNVDTLRNAELERTGTVQVSQHPQVGELRELAGMMRFSRSRAGHQRYAPLPGEHTDELLGELGWAASDIESLRAKKVVA